MLRRTTPGSEEVELILIRILKGRRDQEDCNNLEYSPHDRKVVAFALFDLLRKAKGPMAILGNPGFSLSAMASLTREYCHETGHDISQHVLYLLCRDQQLMCLHTGSKTMQNSKRLDATEPDRILIVTSRNVRPIVSSGSAHSAVACEGLASSGSAHSAVTDELAKAKAEALRELCSEAAACADEGKQKWGFLLVSPVHVAKHMTEDGLQLTGPVDIAASVCVFDDSLALIQRAHATAGESRPRKSLSEAQFTQASKWLQHSCFEPRFLHNKDLKEQIRILDNNPDTLSREQKKKIRNARHGACKAWKKTLLGNKDLAHSIMQHGLFSLADMRDFMVAFLDDADKQQEGGAWGGGERLRREAVAARRTLKEAGKLAYMRESELTPWEKKLLQKLDSGKLEEDWQAKERAYGMALACQNL